MYSRNQIDGIEIDLCLLCLDFVDGRGQCLTGPGVGIVWNEEAVARFAV